MQEIKKLLEDIKQTGEGSLELKIENIVYERRFYRPERLIILGGGNQQICVCGWFLRHCSG